MAWVQSEVLYQASIINDIISTYAAPHPRCCRVYTLLPCLRETTAERWNKKEKMDV